MHDQTIEVNQQTFQRQLLTLGVIGTSMLILFGALIALMYLG